MQIRQPRCHEAGLCSVKKPAMACQHCERDVLQAQETCVPDSLSWRELWTFARCVALLGLLIFLTCIFTQDKFTNYDVITSGPCENIVSSECPRGNLECQSLPE